MRIRLITKFTLVTSTVLLMTMGLFAYSNIQALKDSFLQEAIHDVDDLSETIIRTTHYQMLEDDRKRVYQMIEEVGSQQGIEHIRLINKDGVIIFSTEASETGGYLDKQAEACSMCHSAGQTKLMASTMNRSRVFEDRNGMAVLGMAKGIYNQQSCSSATCHFHPPTARLLGVLDVIVSLEGMKARTLIYQNSFLVLTLFLLLLLALCLTWLTQKLINQPVHRLLQQARQVARGDLQTRIGGMQSDELGELAEAFNEMTDNLSVAREELQQWGKTLETKVEERTRENLEMQSHLVRSEKLASLGQLVAGVAHEINNPLTGILMYTGMLRGDERLPGDVHPTIDTITHETERCGGIVRGLLDFARESVPCRSVANIADLLDHVVSLVVNQAAFQNIRVVRTYAENLPEIWVDVSQLEQVFMNMVLNAGQAMPDGGELFLQTSCDEAEDMIEVTITDTGCGIPVEIREKIFDPFFSTKEHQGTGLGLSVSFGIIENHGGTIDLDSECGQGTRFRISIPIQQAGQASGLSDRPPASIDKAV